MSKVSKVKGIYKRYGFWGFLNKLMEKLSSPVRSYDAKLDSFFPTEEELKAQREDTSFAYRPKINVVVPAYETPEQFLRDLVDSLRAQTYDKWELCIADGSSSDAVKRVLDSYTDERICYHKLEKNGGISENTNGGIPYANGDYIGFMDHDDVLSPNAMYEVARAISAYEKEHGKKPQLLYSDEDKVSADLRHFSQPHFKSDFNLELLRDNNYICHFTVVSRELLGKVGGFRKEYDGSQDYDFILRCAEQTQEICHIPKILYHWRMHDASTAGDSDSKDYTFDAGKRALEAHFSRLGILATVENRQEVGCYHVIYEQKKIPSVHAFAYGEDADAASINRQLQKIKEDYILFKDPALRIRQSDWLEELFSYAMQSDVGIVGSKTYTSHGKIDQNGLVYYADGTVVKAFEGLRGSYKGYCRKAVLAQEVSGASLSLALVRKDVLLRAGGLPEDMTEPARSMELSRRIHALGLRVIQDPYVEADDTVWHRRTAEFGGQKTGKKKLQYDPCYNPNFLQSGKTYRI